MGKLELILLANVTLIAVLVFLCKIWGWCVYNVFWLWWVWYHHHQPLFQLGYCALHIVCYLHQVEWNGDIHLSGMHVKLARATHLQPAILSYFHSLGKIAIILFPVCWVTRTLTCKPQHTLDGTLPFIYPCAHVVATTNGTLWCDAIHFLHHHLLLYLAFTGVLAHIYSGQG